MSLYNPDTIVHTELRFVRLMEELDSHFEYIQDIGGSINEISDNGLSEEEVPELEKEIEKTEAKIHEIGLVLGADPYMLQFDTCVQNRWELYAQLKGAEIVSLRKIYGGPQ